MRICENTHHFRRAIVLRQSVKSTVQTTPTEFESYASGLAMLALDLSYISLFLGCSSGAVVESVVQVDKTLLAIHETLLTSTLSQLVANSLLWQYMLQPLKANPPLPKDQGPSLLPDLDDVTDCIITRNFVEINGGSAEWNLIDKDD